MSHEWLVLSSLEVKTLILHGCLVFTFLRKKLWKQNFYSFAISYIYIVCFNIFTISLSFTWNFYLKNWMSIGERSMGHFSVGVPLMEMPLCLPQPWHASGFLWRNGASFILPSPPPPHEMLIGYRLTEFVIAKAMSYPGDILWWHTALFSCS